MFSSSSHSGTGGNGWGKYKRLRSIGSGSYGTVYLAQITDPTSDDFDAYVAVKTVPLEALGDREASLAMSEVAILRNLSHPHILRFIDCFIDDEHCLCCVTEYVDGGDLASVIKTAKKQRRYVDAFVVVDMLRQALEGLSYLHSQAVLHRDIKPGNIYVTRGGSVKIGDFGVSKLVSEAAPHAVTFIGTPFYLCPELCMGEPYSFGADVWALGVTAFELYTLKLPFHASNVMALANIIGEGNYDKGLLSSRPMPDAQRQELLHSCGPDYLLKTESLGALVASLVQSMIVNDPLDRPSANQLLSDFYGISSAPPDPSLLANEQQFLDDEVEEEMDTCNASLQPPDVTSRSTTLMAGILAMSKSMEAHLRTSSLGAAPLVDELQDNDAVCVGDDDDDRCDAGRTQTYVTNNNDASCPPGWASAYGSVYADPHALEKALRDKALAYHRKRQERLKALRDASTQKTTTPAVAAVSPAPFHTNVHRQGFVRPPSAVYLAPGIDQLQSTLKDPAALKTMKLVARSLVAKPDPAKVPFDPPRVHFSDMEEEEEEEVPVAVRATVTLTCCSLGGERPACTLVLKKVRADTTVKRLVKRIRAAIRSGREPSASREGEAAETAVWLQAHCPESWDDVLASQPLAEWHLSVCDREGDLISISTAKEWRQMIKAHVAQSASEDGRGSLRLQSDVLKSHHPPS